MKACDARQWEWKRSLIALAVASVSLGIAGCGDEDNSETDNSVVEAPEPPETPSNDYVEEATGTVVGTVVDNNGNPISGATVYIPDGAVAGEDEEEEAAAVALSGMKSAQAGAKAASYKYSVVTDAAGQFSIDNVKVRNVENGNVANETGNGLVTLFVDAPDGYFDLNIILDNEAQVVASGGGIAGGNVTGDFFVDGFVADAGVVATPATTSTVTGTLRNSATGAPIGGKNLTLDFSSFSPDQLVGNGVEISYASGAIMVTATDPVDGTFAFSGVADDSCYTLAASGYSLSGASTGCSGFPSVGTGVEGGNTTALGRVNAVSNADGGDQTPVAVSRVAGVVDQTALVGALTASVTGVDDAAIKISFSEAIAASSATNVRVTTKAPAAGQVCGNGSSETLIPSTATLDTAAAMLTVETASALPVDRQVCVYIDKSLVTDVAGNALVGDLVGGDPTADISVEFAVDGPQDVVLNLKTPRIPVTDLQPTVPMQVFAAVNSEDPLYFTSDAFVSTISDSDCFNTGSSICQLNAEEAGYYGPTDGTLNLLGDAFDDGVVTGNYPPVYISAARVAFETTGANDYVIVVRDSDGDVMGAGAGIPDDADNTNWEGFEVLDEPFGDGFTSSLVVSADEEGEIEVILWDVRPDWVVEVVSRGDVDGDGISDLVDESAVGSVVLEDRVKPTLSVQLLADAIAESIGSGSGGVGGGVVIPSAPNTRGMVYLDITPQSFDIADSSSNSYADDSFNGTSELRSSELPDGAPGVNTDATTTATFVTGATGTFAVSVTEPLSETAVQPVPTISNGVSTFGDVGVLNGVMTEDGLPVDLYTVVVDSLFDLEDDARAARNLNLVGLVDEAGNVATGSSRPVARLRDSMPPLMTLAWYDGTNYVFEWHEVIAGDVGVIELPMCGESINIDVATDSNVVPTAADRAALTTINSGTQSRLVVPVTNPTLVGADPNTCFDDGESYAESAYSASALGGQTGLPASAIDTTPAHGPVTYGSVEDLAGNSWFGWAGVGYGFSTEPTFWAANIIGPFVITSAACDSDFAATSTDNFQCDLTFSHPLNLEANAAVTGDPSAPELLAYAQSILCVDDGAVNGLACSPDYAVVGSVLRDANGANILISGAPAVLITVTVDYVGGGAIAADDSLIIVGNGNGPDDVFVSFYDPSQVVNQDNLEDYKADDTTNSSNLTAE